MIEITNPEHVNMLCIARNKKTGQSWRFKQFLLVGMKEEGGETIIVATDLRDFARALDHLTKVYRTSMDMASPEVRREVEADLIVEATLQMDDEPSV